MFAPDEAFLFLFASQFVMGAPYPFWFAGKVIYKWFWEHKTITTIATELKCALGTASRMIRRWEAGDEPHLPPQGVTRRGKPIENRQLEEEELKALKLIVDAGQELYLDEIADKLRVAGQALLNESAIFRALKHDLFYSRKKVSA